MASQTSSTTDPSYRHGTETPPAEPALPLGVADVPALPAIEAIKRPEPPFWTEHQRSISTVSYCSVHKSYRRQSISLDDNTENEAEEDHVVWAKCVTIENYTVVAGRGLGDWAPGTYVAWNCTVETLEGGSIKLIKRYSEFDDLRERLLMTFPLSDASMPPLPPKSVISKFRPKFLEKRKEGLSYFLNCILLNPKFAGSPVLKDWVFET